MMRLLNSKWTEGTSYKWGFNFDLSYINCRLSRISCYTIFRFGFLLPLPKRREIHAYRCPFTKNVCAGFLKRYFAVYFRVKKLHPFIELAFDTFECPSELKTLMTWEQIMDEAK